MRQEDKAAFTEDYIQLCKKWRAIVCCKEAVAHDCIQEIRNIKNMEPHFNQIRRTDDE